MSIHYGHESNFGKQLTPIQKPYTTVFEVNMFRAEKTGQSSKGSRVGRVHDGKYSLFQNEYRRGPIPGTEFIQNMRKCFMIFKCPEMININISIFITVRVIMSAPRSGNWGHIIGNDNGTFDKFIGYKSNSTNQLSYGGGFPAKEYNCTIQSGVNILDKHLISCHWQLTESCVFVNGVRSPDSDFTANPEMIGEPYGTIFTDEKITGYSSPLSKPFTGNIYDIKIISGFLEQEDITNINSEIMKTQDIL